MIPRRPDLAWLRLDMPLQAGPEAVQSCLRAMATLSGQPLIVLEILSHRGVVTWQLGTPVAATSRVLHVIRTHLTGVRAEPVGPHPRTSLPNAVAASVRFVGAGHRPLSHELSPTVVRALLGQLARTSSNESVCLQLVLGPRQRPRLPLGAAGPERRRVHAKQADFRVQCAVRVWASASDERRSHSLLRGVVSALRMLEAPGAHLRVRRVSARQVVEGRTPWFWPNTLSTADLTALTVWPIGEYPLPGLPPPHPRHLPAPRHLPRAGRVLGLASRTAEPRPIALGVADSLRHLHLLGPTGTGKSTVMANLAVQDMHAGHGVVVIDPKGDLIEDLLARVPADRMRDVVVLDSLDTAPIGLSPLAGDPELAADTCLAIFHSLYADAWGPRTHDILHASLLTLARRGDASLVLIPTLLTNPGFRRSVVGQSVREDPLGLGSFWAWYDGISDAERHAAIAPLMNKLRPILLRPGIRAVLGQRHPRFAFADVFERRRILLVNLSKGRLGPEAAHLLGSLVVGLVWNAALARAAHTPLAKRYPVMLYIDEVQDYLRLPGDLSDALAQGRGLGLGLTLAHQMLAQLPRELREAVLANARSRLCFALSPRDAREIAATTRGALVADDFTSLPAYTAYASLLKDGTSSDWFSLSTQPLPPATSMPDDIRRISRTTYGIPREHTERELLGFVAPSSPVDEPLGRRAIKDSS